MRNHYQNLFLKVSYCFWLFGDFGKVVFHQLISIFKSESLFSILSTNLDKDLLSFLFRRDATTIFTKVKGLLSSMHAVLYGFAGVQFVMFYRLWKTYIDGALLFMDFYTAKTEQHLQT